MKAHNKQPNVRKAKKGPRLGVIKLEPRIAPGTSMQHNETVIREPAKIKSKAEPKKAARLQVVRLEARVAPGIWQNHNETLVREPSEKKQSVPTDRKEAPRPKLRIVKLEERIAPKFGGGGCDEFGCGTNHNETLVRMAANAKAAVAKAKKRTSLKVVKLEQRIAPGIWQNHNETLVRDQAKSI
jgi:hypothetical protein